VHQPSGLLGCELSSCHSLRAEPQKRSWWITRLGLPGSLIWVASNYTHTRSAPPILSTPTNCGSISIRFQASAGLMCVVSLWRRALLEEVNLRGWVKTSGSRGMHVNVRIEPRWTFTEVRRAALALARAVERRAPALVSSKWWKEERHGVFLDYNQNAKDRTTCSAYSVRPLPDARVSAPLHWHEVPECDPADFTIFTIPERFAKIGNPHAEMDSTHGSLDKLLELAERDEAAGLGDAPWPPYFRKMEGQVPRVALSRAKSAVNRSRAKMPLIVVANSTDKAAAMAGLERWKKSYPQLAGFLAPDDVLIDSMRGRSSTWTRIRVNLRHVPEGLRPPQETPDPDDDPTREWRAWQKKKATKKDDT
jgi:bifunctional non-homologous end joining protein LigD